MDNRSSFLLCVQPAFFPSETSFQWHSKHLTLFSSIQTVILKISLQVSFGQIIVKKKNRKRKCKNKTKTCFASSFSSQWSLWPNCKFAIIDICKKQQEQTTSNHILIKNKYINKKFLSKSYFKGIKVKEKRLGKVTCSHMVLE